LGSASANPWNQDWTASRPAEVSRYRPSFVVSMKRRSVRRLSSWYTWLRVILQKPLRLRVIVNQTSAPDIVWSSSQRTRSGGGGPMSSTPSVHAAVEFNSTAATYLLTAVLIGHLIDPTVRLGRISMDAVELVRRYYDEVWRNGNVDAIDELLAADHVDETPPPGFDGTRNAQKQIAPM